MKTVIFFICLMVISGCASRKKQLKRYIDNTIMIRQESIITSLKNSRLSENLTIGFRTLEYDTSGHKIKETTGTITKQKEEIKRDSTVQKDTTESSVITVIDEQIKEKKSRNWYFAIGMVSALLLTILIYFFLKRAK